MQRRLVMRVKTEGSRWVHIFGYPCVYHVIRILLLLHLQHLIGLHTTEVSDEIA